MMTTGWRAAGWSLGLVGCICLTGCMSVQFHRPTWNWPWSDAPRIGDVAQVAAMWADGVVTQADPSQGGKPTPGFSGRIYLLSPGLGETLAANGRLVILLYDDAQPPTAEAIPRESWEIDEINLAKVLRKDAVGWGYNLWLPWTTIQSDVRNITLVAKYLPNQGPELYSSPLSMRVNANGVLQKPSSMQTTRTQQP